MLRPWPDTKTIEPTTTQPVRFGLGNLNGSGNGMAHRLDLVLDCTHGNLLVFRRVQFQAGQVLVGEDGVERDRLL